MANKRRTRSPHPGVKLRKRTWSSGEVTWFGRFDNPDTPPGRKSEQTDVNLTKMGYTTREARKAWAVTKSLELADRRRAIKDGGTRKAGLTVAQAVAWFFETKGKRLRERTREGYQADVAGFVAWAEARRLAADDLRGEHLVAWSEEYAAQPSQRGGLRSPQSVNRVIRSVRAVLSRAAKAGKVHLARAVVRESLEPIKESSPLKDYLPPAQCQALVAAALRHDATTWKVTRAENAGGLGYARTLAKAAGADAPTGSTPRYEPAAPLLACLLLTGMRDSEGRGLRWAQVDLDARDETGKAVGEIRLGADAEAAEQVKTGKGRVIDLAVCPALRLLLVAMKLRAGDVSERPYVFGGTEPFGRGRLDKMRLRLARFGAPAWGPQKLRRTTATALVNSNIFGGATVWRTAQALGHSPEVLRKHYAGLMRVSRDARTLEEVLGVGPQLSELVARVSGAAPVVAVANG